MYLYDPKTRYKIEFTSTKFKVAVSTELIADLKELGVTYQALRK